MLHLFAPWYFPRLTWPAPRPAEPTGSLELSGRSSDPGIQMTIRGPRITLRGVAEGPFIWGGDPAFGVTYRHAMIELDGSLVDSIDVSRGFTEKNREFGERTFSASTRPGMGAVELAHKLARDVNERVPAAARHYVAHVTVSGDQATVTIRRRG